MNINLLGKTVEFESTEDLAIVLHLNEIAMQNDGSLPNTFVFSKYVRVDGLLNVLKQLDYTPILKPIRYSAAYDKSYGDYAQMVEVTLS